jgi:DNA-binding HxlR family transcriptional regulator
MLSQQLNHKNGISISCIEKAASIICSKWTALIIRQLADSPKHFCDLQSIPGISPRILSQRLEDLLRNKIINKEVVSKSPLRTEYSLTLKGKDLIPILHSMATWGDKYSK